MQFIYGSGRKIKLAAYSHRMVLPKKSNMAEKAKVNIKLIFPFQSERRFHSCGGVHFLKLKLSIGQTDRR